MTSQTKKILFIIGAILIILAILFLLFIRKKDSQTVPRDGNLPSTLPTTTTTTTTPNFSTPTPPPLNVSDVDQNTTIDPVVIIENTDTDEGATINKTTNNNTDTETDNPLIPKKITKVTTSPTQSVPTNVSTPATPITQPTSPTSPVLTPTFPSSTEERAPTKPFDPSSIDDPRTQTDIVVEEPDLNTTLQAVFDNVPTVAYSQLGMIDRTAFMLDKLIKRRQILTEMSLLSMSIDRECLLGPDRGFEDRLVSSYSNAIGKWQRKADEGNEKGSRMFALYQNVISNMVSHANERMKSAGPNPNDKAFFGRMRQLVDSVDDYNEELYAMERTIRKLRDAQVRLFEIEAEYQDVKKYEAEKLENPGKLVRLPPRTESEIALSLVQMEQAGEIPTEVSLIEEDERVRLAMSARNNLNNELTACRQEVKRPEYNMMRLADDLNILYCPLEVMVWDSLEGRSQLNWDMEYKAPYNSALNAFSITTQGQRPTTGMMMGMGRLTFDAAGTKVISTSSPDGTIDYKTTKKKDTAYGKHKKKLIPLEYYGFGNTYYEDGELLTRDMTQYVKFHKVKFWTGGKTGDGSPEIEALAIGCQSFYRSSLSEYRMKKGIF